MKHDDRRRVLTPKEIAHARSLRRGGLGWTDIARRNRTVSTARAREGGGNPQRGSVPPEVLADRDHRSELSRSITSFICGDPPPGYSALDQKNGRNPS